MRNFTPEEIIATMKKKGYTLFKNGSANLIGIRTNNSKPNSFDDFLFDIRLDGDTIIEAKVYHITTDPGLPYLLKPINSSGTAILKPGQYLGMWAIGLHRGKYEALVQVKPCTVLRDTDKDSTLDFDTKKEEKGLFGINCHRGVENQLTTVVGPHSAGCQVHADGRRFVKEFMVDMKADAKKYGNSFTYTLLEEKDF
jgi:hypothetical protein